jgi:uncharacterized protein (DUF433 family)
MSEAKRYVHLDPDGTYRITDRRVSLDSVVYPFRHGDSAESIRSQYPVLTLEDVYGTIAFYLANQAAVDSYLKEREALWDRLEQESWRNPSKPMKRILALKAAGWPGGRVLSRQEQAEWDEIAKQIQGNNPVFPTSEEAARYCRDHAILPPPSSVPALHQTH